MKSLPRGVITTMFTDIVDSTRIKGAMVGETSARRDATFRDQVKAPHDALVLTCVREAGGYVVNPTGDGYCIAFVDAEEAVLCALRIQHHLTAQPIDTPIGPVKIRIGLHTGVVNPSGDDYIASTVDKTARVQSQAGPGQVFVSHQTQVLVFERMHGVVFESRGVYELKGLQAEQLYEAIPLPSLVFPPVEPQAEAMKPTFLEKPAPQRRKTLSLALATLGVLVFAALVWLKMPTAPDSPPASQAPSPDGAGRVASTPTTTMTLANPTDLLPVGSQWDGNFHFLPPMQQYDGSVGIRITKRSGQTFTGIYSSENDKYEWLIEGKLQGKHLHWEFIKNTKKPAGQDEDAVGKAYGEADIKGDSIKGLFLNRDMADEKAALDLRLTP